MYRVMIFGVDPHQGGKIDFQGEIHEFETKKELNHFINVNSIKPHSKDFLAGKLYHEIPDGRACLAMQGGKLLGLKTTRSVS